jgi:hypothetical protein
MTYFTNFPKIPYEFIIDGKSVLINVVDIALNVRARKAALKNYLIYDEYDIEEGETPESISEKLYGKPHYHWLIMLINDRFDYVRDFPLKTIDLETYITEKYGAGHEFDQHVLPGGQPHYVDPNGNTVHKMSLELFATMHPDIPPEQLSEQYTRYGRAFSTVSNHEYEEQENEKKRRIKVINKEVIEQVADEIVNLIQP